MIPDNTIPESRKYVMKNIHDFFNKKQTILTIRGIGIIYLIAIIINTIFFYGQYMYETFLGSGLCGIIAAFMIGYKIPSRKAAHNKDKKSNT